MALTMTELYKAAFKNIASSLRDLYIDAEEGTRDNMLMKVRIAGNPSYGANLVSYYYIPIQVRKLWNQHYSQVVLDQVETGNRITITTDTSINMDDDGALWIQNCISSFITNRIQLTKAEVLHKKYAHIVYINEEGCMSISMVDANTYHTGFTLADPNGDPVEVFADYNLVTDRYVTMTPVTNTDPGPDTGEDPDDTDEDLVDTPVIRCVENDDGTNSWICETTSTGDEGDDTSMVECTYDEATDTHTWSC